MKKLLFVLVLLLSFAPHAAAQGPIYLPIIYGSEAPVKNGWQIIAPETTTNMVLNPSGETTGNFVAVGAATITRSTTYQKYGLYSYRVQTAANNQGIQLTLSTLSNATHYVTVRVKGKLPTQWGFSLNVSPYIPPVLLETLGDGWYLYGLDFGANRASGGTFLRVGQLGPGSGDFYLDGIQVEAKGIWTTYCDGTQDGCAFNGPDHAATSTRSSESRAGGLVKDFYDDYGFFVEKIVGAGATTQTLSVDEYALLPGGELNSVKSDPRQMTIIGKFIGDSEKDLHDKRQDLFGLLSDESFPANQPIKIRFTGASVPKEIGVYYQSGLEGELNAFYCKFAPNEDNQWERLNQWTEKCGIQLQAPDPFWYEVGESAVSLDTNDSATFRLVAGRLKSTGQWGALGPPAAPGTAVYTDIRAIAEDATYIYIGGNFQNFDNIANADYIARYNKQTGVWSALGTGVSNVVYALAIGPDGTLYAGGLFATAGGVAVNRIASWNGTAWSALGAGTNSDVYALTIGLDGTLYAGGLFTTAGGGAANYVASWNGAAWAALSTGMNSFVYTLAIGPDGTLYAGGDFTTAGGVTVNRVASWDGSAWAALSTGMNNWVYALAISSDGVLYAGGTFTTAGGVSTSRIARWNGMAWSALGSGMNSAVFVLSIGQDGTLYAGGDFTTAGGISLADRVARFNGYAWAHLDINLPGTPTIYAIVPSKYVDPVIEQKYDLWLGFDTTGTGTYAGKVAITNDGTAPAFPKSIFSRSGGTSATIETLRNERNGQELLFNYALLNGETLTIDLEPTQKSIVSGFFGSRLDAVLPNCDFGEWQLLPGSNDITSFVNVAGGPTVTAYLLWRDKYKSWD